MEGITAIHWVLLLGSPIVVAAVLWRIWQGSTQEGRLADALRQVPRKFGDRFLYALPAAFHLEGLRMENYPIPAPSAWTALVEAQG